MVKSHQEILRSLTSVLSNKLNLLSSLQMKQMSLESQQKLNKFNMIEELYLKQRVWSQVAHGIMKGLSIYKDRYRYIHRN